MRGLLSRFEKSTVNWTRVFKKYILLEPGQEVFSIWLFLSSTDDIGTSPGESLKLISNTDIYEIQSRFIPGKAFQEHPGNYPRVSVSILVIAPQAKLIASFKNSPEEILIPNKEGPILEMKQITDSCLEDIHTLYKIPPEIFSSNVLIAGLFKESPLRVILGVMLIATETLCIPPIEWIQYNTLHKYSLKFPWVDAIYHLEKMPTVKITI